MTERLPIARARWHTTLERIPRVYLACMGSRFDHDIVDAGTAIVIEGCHGSGSSFARAAVQHANPSARIASHLHSAHLSEGIRREIPTLGILRDPSDSIPSLLSPWPGDRPRC